MVEVVDTATSVSRGDEDNGKEKHIGSDSVWRQIRKPYTKTFTWIELENEMERMNIQDYVIKAGGKRSPTAERRVNADRDRGVKKARCGEEMLADMLATWDASVDVDGGTYFGEKVNEDEGGMKEGERFLLNCLFE